MTKMLAKPNVNLLSKVAIRMVWVTVLHAISRKLPPRKDFVHSRLQTTGKTANVFDEKASVGVEVISFNAEVESEFEGVFATMAQRQAGGLLVGADPFFNSRRAR